MVLEVWVGRTESFNPSKETVVASLPCPPWEASERHSPKGSGALGCVLGLGRPVLGQTSSRGSWVQAWVSSPARLEVGVAGLGFGRPVLCGPGRLQAGSCVGTHPRAWCGCPGLSRTGAAPGPHGARESTPQVSGNKGKLPLRGARAQRLFWKMSYSPS